MFRVAVREVVANRGRLLLTLVSVSAALSLLVGSFVLRDSFQSALGERSVTSLAGADVVVRGRPLFDVGAAPVRAPVAEAAVASLGDLTDVDRAAAFVVAAERATVLDGEAQSSSRTGGDTADVRGRIRLVSWMPGPLTAAKIVAGRPPEAAGEVALDQRVVGTAQLGARMTLAAPSGAAAYVVVGLVGHRPAAPPTGYLSVAEAQRVAGRDAAVDEIRVLLRPTATPEALVAIRRALPERAEAVSAGQARAEELRTRGAGSAGPLLDVLLLIALLSLGVASLLLANTFAILATQRRRQLGLLRAVGASRAQLFAIVAAEAAVIGATSAAIAIPIGMAGASFLLRALPKTLTNDLPIPLRLTVAPAALALVVGVVVTTGSAVWPAWLASRSSPLSALRLVTPEHARISKGVVVSAAVLWSISLTVLAAALATPGDQAVELAAFGAVLTMTSAVASAPLAALAVATSVLWRHRPHRAPCSTLARRQVIAAPRRAGSAAAGLVLAVGLVTTLATVASSLEASIGAKVARGFRGDFVLRDATGAGLPVELADQVARLPTVAVAAQLQRAAVEATYPDGTMSTERVAAAEPANLARVATTPVVDGTLGALATGPPGVAVDRSVAERRSLAIGDRVSLLWDTGIRQEVAVEAVTDDILFAGNWLVAPATFSSSNRARLDYQLPLLATPGADRQALRDQLESLVAFHPNIEVLDGDAFSAVNAASVRRIATAVEALLALALIVGLLSIANALVLSIAERSEELAVFDAVGMTARQLRAMLQWDAVVMAVAGAGLGITAGLGIAYTFVHSLSAQGFLEFDAPWSALASAVVAFGAASFVAALPAKRQASRVTPASQLAT